MGHISPGTAATYPVYTTANAFEDPDQAALTAARYYLYDGSTNGGISNLEYGHVACAYDSVQDPWVDNQDPVGAGDGPRPPAQPNLHSVALRRLAWGLALKGLARPGNRQGA